MCMCVYHRHIHDNTHRESKTSDADTMRTKSLQCSFLLFLSPLSLFHLSFTRFYSTLSSSLSVPLYLSLYVSFFPFSMSFNFSPPLSHLLYNCLYFLPLIPLSPSFYRYFSSFSRLVFFSPLSSLSLSPSSGYQSPLSHSISQSKQALPKETLLLFPLCLIFPSSHLHEFLSLPHTFFF